ncbi:chromosomal replication initiator protein DnaA [Mycolicibacterium arseniciresistens]|uniref:Serine/threonine protein kinase n=1 Tax=Mycolicibacterium arseniciresistens TaxID=3062257 RepID=A0ABT8UMW7_9MYCO|nr:hypothetical protein [Mycolicibacterium arseniciresistens]MDO3638145.1 hypothetical protein [Mycolicibacterium arseniciresistens]
MTWPPPPPASDPWESQTVPPGESPPRFDEPDDVSAPDPQPFEGGWETPAGARVSQAGAAEPPFPVPAFDPDWNLGGERSPAVTAADEPPTTDAWETPADADAIELETVDQQPRSDAEDRTAAVPTFAGDAWETPSDPVIQPMAHVEPPAEAPGWEPPRDPVVQPPVGAGHDQRLETRWETAGAPGAEPAAGPPPEYAATEGQWSGLYNAPPPVVPRPTGHAISLRVLLIGGGALVALVLVVVMAMWLLKPSPAADTTAATTSEPAPVDTEAQDRLLRAVPRGYAPQACEPSDASGEAAARVSCAKNTDPGGPDTSTYTLYPDRAALDDAFESLVASSQVVVCPGRIQSPGPWRRNATPDKVSGTLLCALDQNRPTVSWTDVDEMFIGTVEAAPGGPTFDQLYSWWAAHS